MFLSSEFSPFNRGRRYVSLLKLGVCALLFYFRLSLFFLSVNYLKKSFGPEPSCECEFLMRASLKEYFSKMDGEYFFT